VSPEGGVAKEKKANRKKKGLKGNVRVMDRWLGEKRKSGHSADTNRTLGGRNTLREKKKYIRKRGKKK